MNKKLLIQDIASLLSARLDITKKKADSFARAFFEVILDGLRRDKYVKIKDFGTFKVVIVEERESVNIKNGERFRIDSYSKISFTPDAAMKELVNRPFSEFKTIVLNDEATDDVLSTADLQGKEIPEIGENETTASSTVVETSPELPTPPVEEKPTETSKPQEKENDSPIEDADANEVTDTDILPPIPTIPPATAVEEASDKEDAAPALPQTSRKSRLLWLSIPLILTILGIAFLILSNHKTPKPSEIIHSTMADTAAVDTVRQQKALGSEKANSGNWTIVIMQGVPEEAASNHAETMKKDGYVDAEVARHNGNTAIIYGHYSTREEAYAKWNEMRGVSYFNASLPDTCR